MKFIKRNGPRGRKLYFQDGAMVSPKNIPPEILEKLETQDEFDTADIPLEPEKPVKKCLFCGEPATKIRMAMGQQIDLCDDDYYMQSLGKIVTKLRSLHEAKEKV